jgi:hypothetical protein
MSFSAFDPAVMLRVLGRPASRPDPRMAAGPAERLERSADFETARMNDVYRQMEQALRELIAHPFVREDASTLGRIEKLLFCVDMEDFAQGFDLVARHIEVRLAVLADAGASAGPATDRRRTDVMKTREALPARQTIAPSAPQVPTGEGDGNKAPRPLGQRMRLNL